MRNLKRALSLGLTAAMISGLMVMGSSAAGYADVTSENNQEAIEVLQAVGIMTGVDEEGNFNPDGTVTRNQMAVIMANLMEYNVASYRDTSPFTDVPSWAEPYVAACYTNGITSGYSDTIYGGEDSVTTAQAALMLMKALGYFQYASDFGQDWQLATLYQGNLIDLFVGVDSAAEEAMTRNDVAQLVLNTLKAGTVQASTSGSIEIGGVVINSNVQYNYITSNASYASAIDDRRSTNNDGDLVSGPIVELGEQLYMGDLKLEDNTFDDFNRPSRTWSYDGDEIGTYAKKELLRATYTTGVKGGDIYGDIGASACDYKISYSIDGIAKTGNELKAETDKLERRNAKTMGDTGNGVLTEVYVDIDEETTDIVEIHTYLAEALNDYNEVSGIATLRVYDGVEGKNATTTNYDVDDEAVENVVDVTEGTFYQVNISKKYTSINPDGEIITLADVEVMEDMEITKYSSDDGNTKDEDAKVTDLTTDGTDYEANEDAYYDDEILYQYNENLLTGNTYNVYLDQYGYFLGVDLYEGTQNYVFITGFDRNSSNLAVKTATAGAIFLDGTMENIQVNVTATDKNIGKATGENADLFVKWATPGYDYLRDDNNATNSAWSELGKYGEDGIYNLNQWYTYTVDENGTYTLKPCTRMTWSQYTDADANADGDVIIRTDRLSLVDDHEGITTEVPDLTGRVYGEDDTVFLTVDLDIVDTSNGARAITDINGVYTGVQSVDLVVNTDDQEAIDEGQVYTVFDSKGFVIGAVVIGEAMGNTGNYAYILSDGKNEAYNGDYYTWEFDAILNGERQTLTARSSYEDTIDELVEDTIMELRFDENDYVVDVTPVDDDDRYDNFLVNIKDEDVYWMNGDNVSKVAPVTDNEPTRVTFQRNALYVTDRTDRGLYVLPDAKAFVIQEENGKEVISSYDSVDAAISRLVDADPDTSSIKEYKGDIFAVLNSDGEATWIVFNSETPLNPGQGGGHRTGNVAGLYNDLSIDLNGDGKNDVTLDGSYANIEYTIPSSLLGVMYATMNYTAPEWVPDGATVTVDVDVLYNGNVADTLTFSDTVRNGEAVMYDSSTPFTYSEWTDTNGFTFRAKSGTEAFTAVKVMYFDQTMSDITDEMTGTKQIAVAGGNESISVRYPNNATPSDTIDAGYWTGSVNPAHNVSVTTSIYSYGALNTGVVRDRDAQSSCPITFWMDMTSRQDTFGLSLGTGSANPNVALNKYGIGGTDATNELVISFAASPAHTGFTTPTYYDTKNVQVAFSSNTDGNKVWRYLVEIEGFGSVLLAPGTTTATPLTDDTVNKRIDGDVVITADMVTVTPVEMDMNIDSISWTENTVTIYFTEELSSTSITTINGWDSTDDVTAISDYDGSGVAPAFYRASASGKQVTITFTGETLEAGDTITLAIASSHGLYGITGPTAANALAMPTTGVITLGANHIATIA